LTEGHFLMNTGTSKMDQNLSEKTPTVRYDKNPFIENMVIPVKGQTVKISRLGGDDNILINQTTGEIHGTHLTTTKRVDQEQFVKLFSKHIALTFELKSAGIKAFNILIWMLQNKQIDKDLIPLDRVSLDEFLEAHKDRKPPLQLSLSTFGRGLSELENAKIIAKHLRFGWYFINPNFVFNGDRIAFTTMIERKKSDEEHSQRVLDFNKSELLD